MSDTQYNTLIPLSLAHSFGHITSVVLRYFKSKFPEGYFQTEYVNTQMSYSGLLQIKSDVMKLKKKKPILVVNPIIDFNDMPEYINNSILNSTFIEVFDSRRPPYNLMGVFQDYEKNIYLDGKVSRYKIRYEFTIILETDMQALNICNYLMSIFRHEHPFSMKTMTEIEVPNFIINQISSDSELPIINPDNNTRGVFLTYLNSNSKYPFLYKFQSSTGHEQYFIYADNTLTMIFNDKPNLERASRNNMVKGNAMITETLSVEFNTISTLYYMSNYQPTEITNNINDLITNTTITIAQIPVDMLTKVNEEGWQLYSTALYTLKESIEDHISVKELLDNDIIKCIEYNAANGLDNSIFIDIHVVNDDGELVDDSYYIDWTTYELITLNGDMEKIYRLAIYINNEYVNFIKKG